MSISHYLDYEKMRYLFKSNIIYSWNKFVHYVLIQNTWFDLISFYLTNYQILTFTATIPDPSTEQKQGREMKVRI